MAHPIRILVVALAVFVASCSPRTTTPRSGPRRVVLLLVVDQFAAYLAEERIPRLPADGGFARLARASSGMRILEHGHSVTDTAPGHAALFTGRLPRSHGIGANEVVSDDGAVRSILRDDATRLVTTAGVADRPGSSLVALRGDTLADRLEAREPNARIVALSLKDRGTLFGGGRHPDAAVYFDASLDAFVTSTSVSAAFPHFLVDAASDVPRRHREPWALLDETFVRANATVPDGAPGEGDLGGFGTTFPHDFGRVARPGTAFRTSPNSDVALVDLALASADAFRAESSTLLVAVSFSANDYVGHVFGPSSWEAWDELARLDRELARLLEGFDERFGEHGYSVLLSADHGVFEMPEGDVAHGPWCGETDPYERPCERAVRLDPEALARSLERAAVAELGEGPFVLGIADPYVRLTERARSLDRDSYAHLLRVLSSTIRATPGLLDAIDTHDARACGAVSHPEASIFCEGVVPALGELYLVPRAGAYYDSGYVPGFGAGHGSPYPYDRRVPLLVAPAARAPDVGDLLGEPGSVRRYDTYFAIADRLLGGDGRP